MSTKTVRNNALMVRAFAYDCDQLAVRHGQSPRTMEIATLLAEATDRLRKAKAILLATTITERRDDIELPTKGD